MLLENLDILPILRKFDQDEKSFYEDVTNLKAWLKTQTHLPEIMDERRIQSFLLLNKFHIEKTKKRIDTFYTIRSTFPDLFCNHPKQPEFQEGFNTGYFVPFPKQTENSERVLLFKVRDPKLAENIDPHYVTNSCLHIFELRLFEDCIYNDIYVFDMEHLNITYLTKLLPLVPKFIKIWETVYSMPIKALYILNGHSFLSVILSLVKTLVKAKIFERIHVVENKTLLDIFPKEIVPKDYGGEEKSLEELWNVCKKDIKKYEKYFDERQVKRVDESLRVELINNETMGFYGNFKKLNVD